MSFEIKGCTIYATYISRHEVKELNLTEKRRSTLISAAYFALFVAAYILFIKYVFGMVAPFIFALLIAMLLQKPIRRISEKTRIKKGFLSVVFVLLILVILLGLVVFVGYRLWEEFYDFGKFLSGKLSNTESVISTINVKVDSILSHLPEFASKALSETVDGFTEKLASYAGESKAEIESAAETAATSNSGSLDIKSLVSPIGGILSTAMRIPAILAAVLVGVVACFFITSDYDGFVNLIKKNVTEEHEKKIVQTKRIIFGVLGKWCKSYALLLFITFCEISLSLFIMKLTGLYKGGYIFVIALCTALLDILPVFGTGTVLIPWAVISLFTHKIGLGIGLAIVYVLITVVRQVLEPRLVSMNVNINPVVTLMSMYLGLQIFGALGIIILPITVVIVKTLNDEGIIHLYGRREATAEIPAEVPAGEPPETEDIQAEE